MPPAPTTWMALSPGGRGVRGEVMVKSVSRDAQGDLRPFGCLLDEFVRSLGQLLDGGIEPRQVEVRALLVQLDNRLERRFDRGARLGQVGDLPAVLELQAKVLLLLFFVQ